MSLPENNVRFFVFFLKLNFQWLMPIMFDFFWIFQIKFFKFLMFF